MGLGTLCGAQSIRLFIRNWLIPIMTIILKFLAWTLRHFHQMRQYALNLLFFTVLAAFRAIFACKTYVLVCFFFKSHASIVSLKNVNLKWGSFTKHLVSLSKTEVAGNDRKWCTRRQFSFLCIPCKESSTCVVDMYTETTRLNWSRIEMNLVGKEWGFNGSLIGV